MNSVALNSTTKEYVLKCLFVCQAYFMAPTAQPEDDSGDLGMEKAPPFVVLQQPPQGVTTEHVTEHVTEGTSR
jgi:hypothetical protein